MRPQPTEDIIFDALNLCLDPDFLVDRGRQLGEVMTNEELGSCGAHDVLMGIVRRNNELGIRQPIPSFVQTGRIVGRLLNELQTRR